MASQPTIQVGQMQVGDEGYCAIEAVYLAPSASADSEAGRNVAATSLFLHPDADVQAEPSPLAKVQVLRREDGFVVRVPHGEAASRYLPRPCDGAIPVVGVE